MNSKGRRAVALRYEKTKEDAPRIVAKGASEVADKIIQAASENGVSVLENKPLVEALMGLEIDSVIPAELYQAVAEVLTFVYQSGNRKQE